MGRAPSRRVLVITVMLGRPAALQHVSLRWSCGPRRVLLDGPAALEAAATWDAPVVALVLSALQGLFLFLRA
jgi:hypothetical protein